MSPRTGRLRHSGGRAQGLVGAIEQAVKAPAVAAKRAPLGILQTYATPEQQAAEIREKFRRVGEMVKKAGQTT